MKRLHKNVELVKEKDMLKKKKGNDESIIRYYSKV